MMFIAKTKELPLASSIIIKLLNITTSRNVQIQWTKDTKQTKLVFNNITFESEVSVCRYLALLFPDYHLYGSCTLQYLEVDSWLSFGIGPLQNDKLFQNSIFYLDRELSTITFLVGNDLTIADIFVWSILYQNQNWNVLEKEKFTNVTRWYKFIASQNCVVESLRYLSASENIIPINNSKKMKDDISSTTGPKEEGKFIDLPEAKMGKVVVRFPPEASGYLHIGHAKAALLNQYYRDEFNGQLIMRFDDTNPAKEKVDFEKVILEDLELLEIKPDRFTHTSDYFDLMLQYCEKLIEDGKAYVDDTEPEIMKTGREQKIESKHRNNSVDKNLKMWQEMIAGTDYGVKCCVRAKIDMTSMNGCLRDPTIYRCKPEIHPKTGAKYKVYPTYDFACPIVDSIEGVTHCLRTTEYHDRDDQFYWFIEALELRKPYICEYSRLNMTNTVLSKRKLTWFVEEGYVDGWDDPRFPTVRGIVRRGMTIAGLKQFIIAQGFSRSVVSMEWDKIWAFNKKVIDSIAPRYSALESTGTVPVIVYGVSIEKVEVPKHPKNEKVGKKYIWKSSRVLIDRMDAEVLKENENATFINWGNFLIKKINRTETKITSIEAEENISNMDFKKTVKITWLSDLKEAPFIPCICVYFDHIISKPILAKDEDFKQYINPNTKIEVKMLGDPELVNVKKGEIIQLQRRGFYICDQEYKRSSIYTGNGTPMILFFIPDGHSKETPITAQSKKVTKIDASLEKPEKLAGQNRQEKKKGKIADKVSEHISVNNGLSRTSNPINVEEVSYILESIKKQGDRVRLFKTEKREKAAIDDEVNVLLQLKKKFKSLTNVEWKPGVTIEQLTCSENPNVSSQSSNAAEKGASVRDLYVKVCLQTNKVRSMQAEKVNKNLINTEVTLLANLQERYKVVAGKEWSLEDKISIEDQCNEFIKELHEKVTTQGNKVRQLKAEKSPKSTVDAEVKKLLDLKAEFKNITGFDYKPTDNLTPSINKSATSEQKCNETENGQRIYSAIYELGNKIRQLKIDKVDKEIIGSEVKKLLDLKAEYKKVTGLDYTPSASKAVENQTATKKEVSKSTTAVEELYKKISEQGSRVRELKAGKANKDVIDGEVKTLINLKAEYKLVTGLDYQPPTNIRSENQPAVKKKSDIMLDKGRELNTKIIEQGNKVRQLKTNKSSKETINEEVQILLKLKDEYQTITGVTWSPDADLPSDGPVSDPKQSIPTSSQKAKADKLNESTKMSTDGLSGMKKQTRLGLETKKDENLSDWYTQVITKSELIEYYDVSGCYILRPWAFGIWKVIRTWFDQQITNLGVQECYFPIFVSRAALEREKTHIADFAPEVAWVTKSGDSNLEEPVAIRPTSETVMYPAYAKWIRSHRDLPLKLNQWNNVVRWEFKHPQPFLRTREFLWQEGHTAYSTQEAAEQEVYVILDLYAKIYTDLLAIPVIKGRKTEKEKFAGGDFTTTVEAFVSASGRGIQGATSHHLGQNFAKMFDIVFEEPETHEKKYVFQNSWGMTTRTIGVMIMVHADDQGLVLPPKVAQLQVVIVPCGITASLKQEERDALHQSCLKLEETLKLANIRIHYDSRDNYSSGWKFNHWELKGVPVRIELGPKDIKQNQVVAVRRDTGVKLNIKRDVVVQDIEKLLNEIQRALYDKAEKDLKNHTLICENWSSFATKLNEKNILLSPFCGDVTCEDKIKQDSARDEESSPGSPSMGAKSLCIPFDQPKVLPSSAKCIHPDCQNKAKFYTLFGRSY